MYEQLNCSIEMLLKEKEGWGHFHFSSSCSDTLWWTRFVNKEKGDIILLLCHDEDCSSDGMSRISSFDEIPMLRSMPLPSLAVTQMFQPVIDYVQIKLHQQQI